MPDDELRTLVREAAESPDDAAILERLDAARARAGIPTTRRALHERLVFLLAHRLGAHVTPAWMRNAWRLLSHIAPNDAPIPRLSPGLGRIYYLDILTERGKRRQLIASLVRVLRARMAG